MFDVILKVRLHHRLCCCSSSFLLIIFTDDDQDNFLNYYVDNTSGHGSVFPQRSTRCAKIKPSFGPLDTVILEMADRPTNSLF